MPTLASAQASPVVQPLPAGPAPAPIVKWAGGKSRLLGQLNPLLPPGVELMRHVEPFLGGGALFFARRPERALLCDINPALINTYREVRDNVAEVIRHLGRLARAHSGDAYYQVRSHYNQNQDMDRSERAAHFLYLNKTCFNGLHRVNRRGEFNVPAGSYVNPRILNEQALRAAGAQLQTAELRCEGFETLLSYAKPGDFIYFDPPYEPVSETASFTSYTRNGFSREDQTRLRDVFVALDRRRCRMMLSNSDVPFIRDLYGNFRIDQVWAARAINCNAKKRGRVSEVVVRNYS